MKLNMYSKHEGEQNRSLGEISYFLAALQNRHDGLSHATLWPAGVAGHAPLALLLWLSIFSCRAHQR